MMDKTEMRKRTMTQEEVEIFAGRVFTYDDGHSGNRMKDVAYYVLDLLRQGYDVKRIVGKLQYVRALAGSDHSYGDCITRFSQAIRLCRTTQEWVAFHMQREPKAQEFFTLMQFYPGRRVVYPMTEDAKWGTAARVLFNEIIES